MLDSLNESDQKMDDEQPFSVVHQAGVAFATAAATTTSVHPWGQEEQPHDAFSLHVQRPVSPASDFDFADEWRWKRTRVCYLPRSP